MGQSNRVMGITGDGSLSVRCWMLDAWRMMPVPPVWWRAWKRPRISMAMYRNPGEGSWYTPAPPSMGRLVLGPAQPDGSWRGPGVGLPERPGHPVGWGETATSIAISTSPISIAPSLEMLPPGCR